MSSKILPELDLETIDIINKLTKLSRRQSILIIGGYTNIIDKILEFAPNAIIKVIPFEESEFKNLREHKNDTNSKIVILEPSSSLTGLSVSNIDLVIFSYILFRHNNPLNLLDEVSTILSPIGMLLILDYRAIPLREYVGIVRKKNEGEFPNSCFEEFALSNRYSPEDIAVMMDLKNYMLMKCISWREREMIIAAQNW